MNINDINVTCVNYVSCAEKKKVHLEMSICLTKLLVCGGYSVMAGLMTHCEQCGVGRLHPKHCIHMLA